MNIFTGGLLIAAPIVTASYIAEVVAPGVAATEAGIWVAAISSLSGLLAMVVRAYYDDKREARKERVRLLDLQEAREARESIIRDVAATRETAEDGMVQVRAALETANNTNEKIAQLHDHNRELLQNLTLPVSVVNDYGHAIPVTPQRHHKP